MGSAPPVCSQGLSPRIACGLPPAAAMPAPGLVAMKLLEATGSAAAASESAVWIWDVPPLSPPPQAAAVRLSTVRAPASASARRRGNLRIRGRAATRSGEGEDGSGLI